MRIEKWIRGCRVTVSDWIGKDKDGETPIRIGVEYIAPGHSVNDVEWERVIYCPRREEQKIFDYLDSIVNAMCNREI